ncbi:MAG: hypothetical protein ACRCU9_16480 [Iodobacter sp.]
MVIALNMPLHHSAISEYVTVSVATTCGNHPTLLYQRADIQLYVAKTSGLRDAGCGADLR